MIDLARVRAISLDLDDTLWPIWPVIEAAEGALAAWLDRHAPHTAALFANPHARHELRQQVVHDHPEWAHDLGAIRLETIRRALVQAGDPPELARAAFEVFYAERNRVTLFADALAALQTLSRLYPLVAVTNGNADLDCVGLAPFFRARITAAALGVAKPDRRIFEAAAQALGVEPAHVLHVGDDAHLDVVGALGAGIQTVWLNRSERLWPDIPHRPHEELTSLAELTDLLTSGDTF
jgi:putative hydrolase of the HAD superfamily